MGQMSERGGVAVGLTSRPDVDAVRLRLSAADFVWHALRWVLTLAGAVVVLWIGSAFLTVTPAVAVPVMQVAVVSQGLVTGGGIRPAGGGDGDSGSDGGDDSGSDGGDGGGDSGSDSKGSDSDDKKSEKSDEKKSDEKKSDKKNDEKKSEKKEEKKGSVKKESSEHPSDDADDPENPENPEETSSESDEDGEPRHENRRPEGDDGEAEREPGSREKADRNPSRHEDEEDAEKGRVKKHGAEQDGTEKDSSEKDLAKTDRTDTEGADDDRAEAAEERSPTHERERARDSDAADHDRESASEDAEQIGERVRAVVRERVDEAKERITEVGRRVHDETSDRKKKHDDQPDRGEAEADDQGSGDERRASVRERVREAAAERTQDGAERPSRKSRKGEHADAAEEWADLAEELTSRTGKDSDDSENGEDGEDERGSKARDEDGDVARAVSHLVDEAFDVAVEHADGKHSTDAESGRSRRVTAEDGEQVPADGASGSTRSGRRATADPRGPPSDEEQVSLLRASRDDDDDDDESDDEDASDDDSAEQTERVLEGEIEVDNSKKKLDKSKKDVAAGKTTKAEYARQTAEHDELERQVAEDREQLSDDRAELVDEVVDGHRGLSKRERELDAEEKKVADGTVTKKAHNKNVAAYEKQRDKVYEATDELMEATDRDPDEVSEDDLDGAGSAAGCGSDGAFTACGSVSESADGKRDSERKMCLSGISSGCGASSKSGDTKSEASCDDSGCGSSASSRGSGGEVTSASARCDGDARGCDQRSSATPDGADADCDTGGGSCESRTSGRERDPASTARLASTTDRGDDSNRGDAAGSGSARCTGDCAASSSVDIEDGEARADAEVSCAEGCTGSASSRSDAGRSDKTAVTAKSATNAAADCSVSGGGCRASTESDADGSSEEGTGSGSSAAVTVDCDGECSGNGKTATSGSASGVRAGAARVSNGEASCEVGGGDCEASSSTETESAVDSDENAALRVAFTDGDASASSSAGSEVECATETCTGSGSARTSGAASGDVTGVRDSTGSSTCTVHGAGGGCTTGADTTVADRDPITDGGTPGVVAVSGPVSVSNASASVDCSGGDGECGGTAVSSTSARDTAVSPNARGTKASAECTVTGGTCSGESSSAASSAPDFVATDPATGRPLPGQATSGPSSTASSSGSVTCPAGTACTGSARTSTAAWDEGVAGGAPRTSTGTTSCSGTGGCEARSVSQASSGPGAAVVLSGGQPVNRARLAAGPSAASAAGAAVSCSGAGVCDGRAASAATATDPSVSADARGSRSNGSCEGVSGGGCQAVTNSAASSGPDANVIAPLVQARSTANATVSSETTGDAPAQEQQAPAGQDQPATAPAPTAPGSSANAGGPTVPGASSWTMASATMDCAGGTRCTGTARTSAAGSDGPTAVSTGNGARGPPEGGTTDSATCTSSRSGCHAQTNSTAGSGQVVADIVAEQQDSAAEQARQQATEAEQRAAEAARVAARPGATAAQQKSAEDAAKAAADARKAATEAAELAAKPVTDAPATLSRSAAVAQCSGVGCTAVTTGDTSGLAGKSHTAATCTAAASGCTVSSEATAQLVRKAGKAQGKDEPVPGYAGGGQATSQLFCPEAGCTGRLSGNADATAGADGKQTRSHADGDTRCDGTTACQAQITAGSSITVSTAADPAARFATTSATVTAACDDGSKAGCATRTSSSTETAAGATVRGSASANCSAAGSCYAATGGTVAEGLTEVTSMCAGTGCTTRTDGTAHTAEAGASNTAASRTGCTAGAGGQCAGSSQVGASEAGAMATAGCEGSAGSRCSYSYRAHSSASAPGAFGTATGYGSGTTGGGMAMTTAMAASEGGTAQAGASCAGSAGTNCSYSYRAHSSASAPGAFATATGYGSGGMGGGMVTTTASASGGGNSAQASASCMGSAGTHCSHYYEATASASASHPSGSWARAYAHGSGGGGMGGGGVAVMAYAQAEEGFASAGASCSGAANCSSSYSAHAEAHDELNTPYGKYTADKWATCSGSGNGGCGAWAVAIAGPDGVADAGCSGDGGCDVGGAGLDFIAAEIDTDGLGIFVDENGDPIAIEDVDEDHSAIRVTRGADGKVVVEIKPRGTDKIETHTCPSLPCEFTYGGMTGGNDQGQNNPNGDFWANAPVEGKPGAEHQARGTEGVGIGQDAEGNAEAWVRGRGMARDGRTGDQMIFTRKSQVDDAVNNIRFGNTKGSPFASTCDGGCEWTSPSGEKLVVDGRFGQIQGRDANGAPARIKFTGAGEFTNAQGDVVHANGYHGQDELFRGEGVTDIVGRSADGQPGIYSIKGQTGFIQFVDPNYNAANNPRFSEQPGTNLYKIEITGGDLTQGIKATTPDKNGKGGSLWCQGDCVRTMPGVASSYEMDPRPYNPVTRCKNCQITEQLPTGTGRFPNGFGSVTLFDDSNGGVVTRYTPWGDFQGCQAGAGGRCGFTQYNRSLADAEGKGAGQGGGAICGASGEGGYCGGRSVEGHSQNAAVVKEGDNWVPVRTGLLYPNADGSHAGRFCVGGANACLGEGSPEIDAPPETNGAMAAVLDPSLQMSDDMAEQLSELTGSDGKSLLGRDADERRPLTASEIKQLEDAGEQDVLDAYNRDMPLSQTQNDNAQMSWFEDDVTLKELQPKYQQHQDEIDNIAGLTENALADDNFIDNGEWAGIKPVRDSLDKVAPGLLEKWAPASSRMQLMRGAAWTIDNFKAANAEVGNDRQLVEHFLGDKYDPSKAPTIDQQNDVIAIVANQQKAVTDANYALHTDLGPRMTALNERVTKFNYAAGVIDGRGGPNTGEAIWLNQEYKAITAEQNALTVAQRPYLATIDGAEQTLRQTDLVYADASGNSGWAGDLRDALGRHNRINTLYQRLSVSPQKRQQTLSTTFGTLSSLTELRYTYVRDQRFEAPANYKPGDPIGANQSLMGGRALPSTMLPDFRYIHTAAPLMEGWRNYDGPLKKLFSENKDLGLDSLDGRAKVAMYGVTPQMKEAEMLPVAIDPTDAELKNWVPEEFVGDVKNRIEELSADGKPVERISMPYYQPKTDDEDGGWTTVTLFRVEQEDGSYRYIDMKGAHYSDLQDFRDNNEVLAEDGTLIAPDNLNDLAGLDKDGYVPGTDDKRPTECSECHIVETTGHTKASWWDKFGGYVVGGAMIVGGALLWVGGGVATLATLGAASPLGVAAAIGGTALITAGVAYTTVDAVGNIINRSEHGQSNGFDNPAAVADYIGLAGNLLTVVGVGVGIKAAASGAAQATARLGGNLGVRAATTTAWQRGVTAAPGWQSAWQGAQAASSTTWRGMLGMSAATGYSRVAYGANALAFGSFTYTVGQNAVSTVANWGGMTPAQKSMAVHGVIQSGMMLGVPALLGGVGKWKGVQAVGLPRVQKGVDPATLTMPGAERVVGPGPLGQALGDASSIPPARGGIAGEGGVPNAGRPLSVRQLAKQNGISRKDARAQLQQQHAEANLQLVAWMRNQHAGPTRSAAELVEQLGITPRQARDALRAMNGSRLVEHVNGQGAVRESARSLANTYGVSRTLAAGALRVASMRGLGELAMRIADGSVRPLSIDEMTTTFGISRSDARTAVRMANRTVEVGGRRISATERVRQLVQLDRTTAVETLVRELGMTRAEADVMLRLSGVRGLSERIEAIGRGEYRTLTRAALANDFGVGRGNARIALRAARNIALVNQLGQLAQGGPRPTVETLVRDFGFTPADARAMLRVAENPALVARIGQIARGEFGAPSVRDLVTEFGIDIVSAEWAVRVAGNTALAVEIGLYHAGGVQALRVGRLAAEFGLGRGDVRLALRAGLNPELAQQLALGAYRAGDGIEAPPAPADGNGMPRLVRGDGVAGDSTGDGTRDGSGGPASPGAPESPATPPIPGSPDHEVLPPNSGIGGGRQQESGGKGGGGGPKQGDGDGPSDGSGGDNGGAGGVNTAGLGLDPNPVTGTASGVPPPAGRFKPISARKLARAMQGAMQGAVARPIEAVARGIRTGLFRKRMTVDELRQQIAYRRQLQNTQGEHQDFGVREYEYGGEGLVFVEHRPAAPTAVRRRGNLNTLQGLWRQALEDAALAEVKAEFLERRLGTVAAGERAAVEQAMRAAQNRARQLGQELQAFRKHAPEVEAALRPYLETITDVEALLAEWRHNSRGFDDLVAKLRNRQLSGDQLTEVQRCALVCEANAREAHQRTGVRQEPYDVQIAAVLALDRMPVAGRLDVLLRKRLPRGVVVQMLTGEGKTLVARLWAIKRALEGEPVVVMAHNSTLAREGAEQAARVARLLGIDVKFREPGRNTVSGVGRSEPDGFQGVPEAPANLREIYEAEIVYGSAREIVSDWQRGLHDANQRFGPRHVLMDEVDMLAIDWGRTAYRLGEQAEGSVGNAAEMYAIADLARAFRTGEFSIVGGRVRISPEQARAFAERVGLGGELTMRHIAEIADALTTGWHHRYNREYFTEGDNAVIVDRENGEGMPGNRWHRHGRVEAFEGMTIKPALRTLSEKTLLDYLNAQLSYRGVTGTAKSAADVLAKVYGLEVLEMATNDPRRLAELPRRVFANTRALNQNVAEEILEAHRRGDGRPILILMRDIADTLTFARMLTETLATGPHPVEPRVVNALTTQKLYETIAQAEAGKPFAVTVATARFGRGTDIRLGGDPAFPGASAAIRDLLIAKGGGHVEIVSMFGTRRAVEQGGGRFGRNGEPGTWRESLSLYDPQLAMFANRRLLRYLRNHSSGELTGWRLKLANRVVRKAQERAEAQRTRELVLTVEGKLRPENVVEQAVGIRAEAAVDQAARAVQAADLRLANVRRDFAVSGGLLDGMPARFAELGPVCSELCAAQDGLVTAQREFGELIAQTRSRVPTLPAAQLGPAPAQTDAHTPAERELSLTRATLDEARAQVEAGDLPAAIRTLTRIAQDAVDVADALPGEWGAAEWTAVEARHLVALLQRVALTRQHFDADHHRSMERDRTFLDRLEALVATLPAGTAARAADAIAAQERRLQELLARLDEAARRSSTGEAGGVGRSGATDVGREEQEASVPAGQRWAAEHLLRTVVSGLDGPIVAARDQLAQARGRAAAADADLAALQRRGVRWLFSGLDLTTDQADAVAVALGIAAAEVRLFAADPTVPAGVTGLGEPTGSFQERLDRLTAALAPLETRLGDAAGEVGDANRALADRQAERRTTLVAAVRTAAGDGLPIDRIAEVTGLTPEQVREIIGGTDGSGPDGSGSDGSDGPGSGPTASGGGPVTGGGSDPSGSGPERQSTPPAGSGGRADSRAAGPRKAGPEPRSRGPPWWQRFFPTPRLAWTVVLFVGGLVASLAAVRYGVADTGVLAAGMLWWPGRRQAAAQLREQVADLRRPLDEAEQLLAGVLDDVRPHERSLTERLGWVPALAERLRELGRTDDEIVDDLAGALGVHRERVRARLADPTLAGSATLPPALAAAGLSAAGLLAVIRAEVTVRSAALDVAVEPLGEASQRATDARTTFDVERRAAAVDALDAGVRAATVRRATGLERPEIRSLDADPPTLSDAMNAIWHWALDRWQDVRAVAGSVRQWVRVRWQGARVAVGNARQRVLDRWRGARALRTQIRGVARLQALTGRTARLVRREQRAAERAVTTEQLGWIAWLSDTNAAMPAGVRLSEEQLVRRVAQALGLGEGAVRRLVARALRLDPGEVQPPADVPAAGVLIGQAIAAVEYAFAEAVPDLTVARTADAAAARALRSGRDAAVQIATRAGVPSARADLRLDRAARGRGLAGLRARLVARMGLDVPVAERNRRRLARVGGFGIGAGTGAWVGVQLGIVGGAAVTGPIGLIVAAAGLVAAARAVWTPRQTRGPPWQAFTRGLRAHGLRIGLWLVGGLAVGAAGPTAWGLLQLAWSVLWPIFSQQPGLRGIKALLSPLVSAGLVYRYVLRRQYANQEAGMQTHPRRDARRSAVLAYLFTVAVGLTRAFVPVHVPEWLVLGVVAIAGGIAAAIVQKKDLNRTRKIKSVITGTLSAAVYLVISGLAGGLSPGALRELLNTLALAVLVYASPTVIAEYVNGWVGKIMAPIAKRKAKRLQQKASAPNASQRTADRQRKALIAWLDYKNFSPVDTRLLFRKAIDPVLAGLASVVINLAWVSKAWVEANDSLTALLVRFVVTAVTVLLIGKLVRDPDEHRAGYYGYRGTRQMRSLPRPSRWLWWRGDRLHRRAVSYRKELDELLGRVGLAGPLNEELARRLAARLWLRMSADIHEPLEEWEALPDTPEINQALERERKAAAGRRRHHVDTVALIVPILAADPAALDRVAAQLRRDDRADDAEIVTFQRMLAQALWAQSGLGPEPADNRVWVKRLADEVEERNRLRAKYLAGPRRALLEEIRQYYLDNQQPRHPNAKRARAELRSLEFELKGMSKPHSEPLEAVAQLAEQRERSVSAAAAAEQQALAARRDGANGQRVGELWELAESMQLERSAALLGIEVELTDTHRNWNRQRWDDAIADANESTPNAVPASLLDRLLVIAGRRGPVTAAQLAAQYGGTGWEKTLAVLVKLGALHGDEAEGYRADEELAALWRAAAPRLRRAVRADPLILPGGAELQPLTRRLVGPRSDTPADTDPYVSRAEKDAFAALRELLRAGDLAFRHWHDGWIDDAGIQWRRFRSLGYRLRHSAGRLNWPLPADHPAAPILFVESVRDLVATRWRHAVLPGTHRRRLDALVRDTDRADRLYHRALRAAEFLADQRNVGGLPAEADALLHVARLAQVAAHGALAEARKQAKDALDAIGSYPHQIDRALAAADAARLHAPGADPLPPTAAFWLREIARELDAARKRLNRLHPGPERDEALAEARLSLERYAVDRDYAWETGLYRTGGGWAVMETARVAAKKLRDSHRDLFSAKSAPVSPEGAIIPHHDRLERPYGDAASTGRGMAAATRRGQGNRTNQDAATLVTLPNGDRVAAVVDGVFTYPDSRLAATRFTTAFHAELSRTDRANRTPAQALDNAYHAGLAALVMHYTPGTGHGAVAFVAAYYAADGTITIFNVGTARAYFLPDDRTLDGEQLTTDDSRGGSITEAGIMTRWAGSDYRPEPTITRFEPDVPGVLVLATDGLWRYFDKPGDLTKVIGASADPAAAATRLADAAQAAGGRDDLTAAVLRAIPRAHGLGAAGRSLGGGSVAIGGTDDRMRTRVIGRLANALANSRLLSGEEFPHLAQGPPDAVRRVRITEDDLGDGGRLLAFGWRDAVHAPDGVIVVPAAVARTIERLIAADPAFADWWKRLLRHELEFHVDGDEHTGHRHDSHEAGLAEEWPWPGCRRGGTWRAPTWSSSVREQFPLFR